VGEENQPAAVSVSRQNEDSLRAELSSQRELVSRLHSEISSLSMRAEEEAEALTSRCEGLRSALRAQEGHAEALERELTTRPTVQQVEELRQQLRLMQAVGLGALESEEGHMAGPGAMETLLLEKTRKLEHQVTTWRLELAQTSGEAESASAKVADLEALVQEREGLIARLEEDLLAAKPGSRAESTEATFLGTADRPEAGGAEEGGERTMVAVLCSQRDRFRKRVSELEEENMQMDRERKAARRDLDTAKADNVALVERLRYVQGYRSKNHNPSDVESGHIENKYDTAYEAKINPFSDWKQREKAARKTQLSVADRMMYEFGQFISSSQKARMFVVAYGVALHLMVFFVIARWGHGSSHHIGGTELQLLCTRMGHQHGEDARLPGR